MPRLKKPLPLRLSESQALPWKWAWKWLFKGRQLIQQTLARYVRPRRSLAYRWQISHTLGLSHTLGQRGERLAARLLRKKGHRILFEGKRNRFGELDLVSIDERSTDRTLVFTEVKTRRNTRGGSPAEAVTPEKQRRLSRTAVAFLKTHDLMEHPSRFDVISIVWPRDMPKPTNVQHLKNAF